MTVKQHRDTRQRKLILDAVRRHTDHPSADQIFIEVRSTDSKISRGTVYRNLNYLADAGEITHVRVPGADRYEIRTDFHYHLYCTGCGTVRNVPLEYHHDADRDVAEASGYTVFRHRTVFEGLCPKCQERKRGAHRARNGAPRFIIAAP